MTLEIPLPNVSAVVLTAPFISQKLYRLSYSSSFVAIAPYPQVLWGIYDTPLF